MSSLLPSIRTTPVLVAALPALLSLKEQNRGGAKRNNSNSRDAPLSTSNNNTLADLGQRNSTLPEARPCTQSERSTASASTISVLDYLSIPSPRKFFSTFQQPQHYKRKKTASQYINSQQNLEQQRMQKDTQQHNKRVLQPGTQVGVQNGLYFQPERDLKNNGHLEDWLNKYNGGWTVPYWH